MTENRQLNVYYGYFIAFAGFCIVVMGTTALGTFGIFFEPLLKEFGWTRAVTASAMSISALIGGICGIVAGRLTDRFGPRLVITIGCFFSGLGLALLSQISTVWQLCLCCGIIAVGGSCDLVPIMSSVTRWFVRRRGMMTSIIISALGAGEMIMPQLARWLISSYGWRTSYIILGLSVFVVILLAAQFIRRDPGQMGLLPYGGSKVKQDNLNLQMGGLSLQEAIRTREFWILCAIMLCYFFSQSYVSTHIVIYATGLGISRVSAANIMVIIGGMYITSLNIVGNVTDRIGKRSAIALGFILQSVALFCFLVAKETWMFYLCAIIFGLGRGSAMAPMPLLMADVFGLRSFGVIQGAIFFGASAGTIIGPILTGHIFDTTGSYSLASLSCGVFAIIGLILISLVRPAIRREKQITS